jgi:hypothetical protein
MYLRFFVYCRDELTTSVPYSPSRQRNIVLTTWEAHMARANLIACVVGTLVVMLGAAASAQAQTVTFSRIDDAVSSRWVDPTTTRVDTTNRNKLIVGFNKGLDSSTFKYREFRASTAAFNYTAAMDTISVRLTAPSGYYIAKVTYTQRGSGSQSGTGRAQGAASWIVADISASLGTFSTNPTLSRTIDIASRRLTVIPVSITNSLNVFSTTSLGAAMVSITGADITVQLARK